MIWILGSEGNMGLRYRTILNHLKMPWEGFDLGNLYDFYHPKKPIKPNGVIIATPTPSHVHYIRSVLEFDCPILCEKPISTEFTLVRDVVQEAGNRLEMVHQYEYMTTIGRGLNREQTHYDYFKHGKDGLAWDCIQIFAMGNHQPILGDTSPVWDCQINGLILNPGSIDRSYVLMIQRWLEKETESSFHKGEALIRAHEKVLEYVNAR